MPLARRGPASRKSSRAQISVAAAPRADAPRAPLGQHHRESIVTRRRTPRAAPSRNGEAAGGLCEQPKIHTRRQHPPPTRHRRDARKSRCSTCSSKLVGIAQAAKKDGASRRKLLGEDHEHDGALREAGALVPHGAPEAPRAGAGRGAAGRHGPEAAEQGLEGTEASYWPQ